MSLKDQKYCILSWLVGEELASDIVRGNDILTIEVILLVIRIFLKFCQITLTYH